MPRDIFRNFDQIIFRKRTKDFLGNPKAERLLTEASVGEYVILGIGLEMAIRSLALGLITRMKRVAVVYDACGYWNVTAADLSLRQMEAKGARLICVEELCSMRRRYPNRNGNGHNGSDQRRRLLRLSHLKDPSIPIPALIRVRLADVYKGDC